MQSEFENWAREKPWFKPERDGKERDDTEFVYADFVTDMAWLSWQEARKVNTDLLEALIAMNAQLEAEGYMGTTYGPLRLAATKAINKALA